MGITLDYQEESGDYNSLSGGKWGLHLLIRGRMGITIAYQGENGDYNSLSGKQLKNSKTSRESY
jgi:hypothetical protein